MVDEIDPKWQDCIFVNKNDFIAKSIKPLLRHIEANSYTDPHHQNRIICDLKGKKAVLLEQGDVYSWHSDSFSFNQRILTNPRYVLLELPAEIPFEIILLFVFFPI